VCAAVSTCAHACAALALQTGFVRDQLADQPAQTWRPWSIWLPCTLAFTASGLLIVADALAMVMGSWDTPAPGLRWIKAAIIGHCALVAASVVVLGAGIRRPGWRPAAAVSAWMIIPAGVASFLLAGRLASGS
jgi:hypothetical protein